jgi:glycosyltransferase involved in cell wall biosynthesis
MFTSLDVVIPIYNSASWIAECIRYVERSLDRAGLRDSKIFVIDDGSTDNLKTVVNELPSPRIQLISQENLGRALARLKGAKSSDASHILFIDSRVHLHQESIYYVLPFLKDPMTSTWTADVHAKTSGNDIARFWMVIEHVFWRKYYKQRLLTRITPSNFDFYPKGTTALIAPRQVFIEATLATSSNLIDPRKVNDDTALLRFLNTNQPIMISPHYSCTYNARSSFLKFLKHANHRGAVLIDGHWRHGTRLRRPISISLALIPVILGLFVMFPRIGTEAIATALMVCLVALVLMKIGFRNSVTFICLVVPFGFSYFLGMLNGVRLRVQTKLMASRSD